MSARFKEKLEYQASEPAFLRRLRASQAGVDPDRHERPIPRPRKAKVAEEEGEEAPVYVDEDSNRTLSKEEFDALVNKTTTEHAASDKDTTGSAGESSTIEKQDESPGFKGEHAAPARQKPVETKAIEKKRKALRIVDDEDVDDDIKPASKNPAAKKPKKKLKAVALSFANDDG